MPGNDRSTITKLLWLLSGAPVLCQINAFQENIKDANREQIHLGKEQAEAEVVPSSSLVEV